MLSCNSLLPCYPCLNSASDACSPGVPLNCNSPARLLTVLYTCDKSVLYTCSTLPTCWNVTRIIACVTPLYCAAFVYHTLLLKERHYHGPVRLHVIDRHPDINDRPLPIRTVQERCHFSADTLALTISPH